MTAWLVPDDVSGNIRVRMFTRLYSPAIYNLGRRPAGSAYLDDMVAARIESDDWMITWQGVPTNVSVGVRLAASGRECDTSADYSTSTPSIFQPIYPPSAEDLYAFEVTAIGLFRDRAHNYPKAPTWDGGGGPLPANPNSIVERVVRSGGGDSVPQDFDYALLRFPTESPGGVAHFFTGITHADGIDSLGTSVSDGMGGYDLETWVSWVEVAAAGSGYTSDPSVSGSTGGAEIIAWRDADGTIADATVADGGSQTAPTVPMITVSGGGGTGAILTAHTSEGVVAVFPYTNYSHEIVASASTVRVRGLAGSVTADWVDDTFIRAGFDPNLSVGYVIGTAIVWGATRTPSVHGKIARNFADSATLRWYRVRPCNVAAGIAVYEYSTLSSSWAFIGGTQGSTGAAAAVGSELASYTVAAGSPGPIGLLAVAYPLPSIAPGTWVVPVFVLSEADYDTAELDSPQLWLPFRPEPPPYDLPIGQDTVIRPP